MISIEIEPVDYYCHLCDSALEYTGCESPYCSAYRCLNCGAGCDVGELDAGHCAVAVDRMTYAQRHRMWEERHRAWGLQRPLRTVHLPEKDPA